MRRQEQLDPVEQADPLDAIVRLGAPDPYSEVPKGAPDTDLLCGHCGVILLEGWSKRTTAKVFSARYRLLGRCGECHRLNLIPSSREKTFEEIEAGFARREENHN